MAAFIAAGLAASGQDGPATDVPRAKPQEKPLFRVGVETVFVKVSVTDPLNRYVTGLEQEHFQVFEDKVEQTISHFTQQSAPISVGILFDVSGSMKDNNNINAARNAIVRFLQSGNPEDEFFLVTFNQKTTMVTNFTHESSTIQSEIAFRQPGGRTALYDAVYMGLDQIKGGKNEKKALILITDGEDNSSRYSATEVREFAKESDVQIYGIGEEGKLGYGRAEIQNIVALTGGTGLLPEQFQRAGLLHRPGARRTPEPVRDRLRPDQQETRWQVAQDPGEAGSSRRPSQADCAREGGILCPEELLSRRAACSSPSCPSRSCSRRRSSRHRMPGRIEQQAPKSEERKRPKPELDSKGPQENPENQKGYTIGVNVDLVVIHTTVLDKNGRFVSGLNEAELQALRRRNRADRQVLFAGRRPGQPRHRAGHQRQHAVQDRHGEQGRPGVHQGQQPGRPGVPDRIQRPDRTARGLHQRPRRDHRFAGQHRRHRRDRAVRRGVPRGPEGPVRRQAQESHRRRHRRRGQRQLLQARGTRGQGPGIRRAGVHGRIPQRDPRQGICSAGGRNPCPRRRTTR